MHTLNKPSCAVCAYYRQDCINESAGGAGDSFHVFSLCGTSLGELCAVVGSLVQEGLTCQSEASVSPPPRF